MLFPLTKGIYLETEIMLTAFPFPPFLSHRREPCSQQAVGAAQAFFEQQLETQASSPALYQASNSYMPSALQASVALSTVVMFGGPYRLA